MFCFFAINLVGSPRGDGDYIVEMWMGITLHYIGDGEIEIYIGGKKNWGDLHQLVKNHLD